MEGFCYKKDVLCVVWVSGDFAGIIRVLCVVLGNKVHLTEIVKSPYPKKECHA